MNHKELPLLSEALDKIGLTRLAMDLGCTKQAIHTWKHNGIPWHSLHEIASMLEALDCGYTAHELITETRARKTGK